MPAYTPKLNNDPEYLRLVTCYGYGALNIRQFELPVLAAMAKQSEKGGEEWGGPQPGALAAWVDQKETPVPRNLNAIDGFNRMSARDGVIRYEGEGVPPPREGYHRFALMGDTPGNPRYLHLVREDGAVKGVPQWSHKYHTGPVSNVDDKGQAIPADPRQGNWVECPHFHGFYYAPIKRSFFKADPARELNPSLPGHAQPLAGAHA
jgi:hypothetical protein